MGLAELASHPRRQHWCVSFAEKAPSRGGSHSPDIPLALRAEDIIHGPLALGQLLRLQRCMEWACLEVSGTLSDPSSSFILFWPLEVA